MLKYAIKMIKLSSTEPSHIDDFTYYEGYHIISTDKTKVARWGPYLKLFKTKEDAKKQLIRMTSYNELEYWELQDTLPSYNKIIIVSVNTETMEELELTK